MTDENGNTLKGYFFDCASYPDMKIKATDASGAEYVVSMDITIGGNEWKPDQLFISEEYTDSKGNKVRDVKGVEYDVYNETPFGMTLTFTGYRAAESLSITDNGTIGDDIDPQELLYVGGESITAETIEQKDGTLFLGNVTIIRPTISDTIKTLIK